MMHRRNQDPGRLRRKRIETGLNQTQLAARAELSTAHMSAIESGRRGASPKVLRRLAEVLDCQIADLMPPEPAAAAAPGSPSGAAA